MENGIIVSVPNVNKNCTLYYLTAPKLLVVSEPNAPDAKLAPQTVLIDLTPNLIMEWGRRKGE